LEFCKAPIKVDEILNFLIDLVKTHFLKKEFAWFIVIGSVNTFNGTVVAYAYSVFLQANLAFILGYKTALVIAYFLNSSFVFYCKPEFVGLMKFALSYVPNFIIQNILVLVLYNGLQWNRLLVFTLAATIGIPLTFVILKVFVFRKKENP